jgi:E3 ubiquitin-protein ligase DOA10
MTERPLRGSGSTTEPRQCRICLESGEEESMSSPCSCKGSIEFVHRACLKEYFCHRFKAAARAERRRMKERLECEICK